MSVDHWLAWLLGLLALPQLGLSTLFVVSFLSATLLPLGSEPALFGLIKLNPTLFWPAVLVATAGNTLGGMLDWWMGHRAHKLVDQITSRDGPAATPKYSTGMHSHALRWLEKLGPKACLLSWLPLIGDPLCAVAGWLKLSFWPCVGYMVIGKFVRYIVLTGSLLWAFPG